MLLPDDILSQFSLTVTVLLTMRTAQSDAIKKPAISPRIAQSCPIH
jgi:hypothetical protein